MVVFVDEILHIPLLCLIIQCSHKFSTATKASDILRPPQLVLPPKVLLCAKTFTAANKFAKVPLILVPVPLAVILPNTKSLLISVVVIKVKSFILTAKNQHRTLPEKKRIQ
jgi:hypothetical protein